MTIRNTTNIYNYTNGGYLHIRGACWDTPNDLTMQSHLTGAIIPSALYWRIVIIMLNFVHDLWYDDEDSTQTQDELI